MFLVSYQIGCRKCLNGDGLRHTLSFQDEKESNFKRKSEFEVLKIVEQFYLIKDGRCQFCNSKNLEFYDINVGTYPLYDFERIGEKCVKNDEIMFMINIEKQNYDIDLMPGGSPKIHRIMLNKALRTVVSTINLAPDSYFEENGMGSTFICITSEEVTDRFKVESFRSTGISKSDILNKIFEFAENLGIPEKDLLYSDELLEAVFMGMRREESQTVLYNSYSKDVEMEVQGYFTSMMLDQQEENEKLRRRIMTFDKKDDFNPVYQFLIPQIYLSDFLSKLRKSIYMTNFLNNFIIIFTENIESKYEVKINDLFFSDDIYESFVDSLNQEIQNNLDKVNFNLVSEAINSAEKEIASDWLNTV